MSLLPNVRLADPSILTVLISQWSPGFQNAPFLKEVYATFEPSGDMSGEPIQCFSLVINLNVVPSEVTE